MTNKTELDSLLENENLTPRDVFIYNSKQITDPIELFKLAFKLCSLDYNFDDDDAESLHETMYQLYENTCNISISRKYVEEDKYDEEGGMIVEKIISFDDINRHFLIRGYENDNNDYYCFYPDSIVEVDKDEYLKKLDLISTINKKIKKLPLKVLERLYKFMS